MKIIDTVMDASNKALDTLAMLGLTAFVIATMNAITDRHEA